MQTAIRAYNAGQVRTWRKYQILLCWTSEIIEPAIRAYNAGQVRTWRQLSELIMLDK